MRHITEKLSAALSFGSVFAPLLAFAQVLPRTNLTTPEKAIGLLCTIAGWFFTILIVLSIIFVLIAAFNYLTAQGDPEKVQSANRELIFAAVAVGVAILARALPIVVGSFLNVGGIEQC